ncbi:MAG: DUF3298 domain-containing protein [Candidatus Paceibacterota bacterium]
MNIIKGNKKIISLLAILVLLIITTVVAMFFYSKNIHTQTKPISQVADKTLIAKTDFYDIKVIYPAEPLDKNGIMEQFVKQQIEQRKEDWKIGGPAYNDEKNIEKDFPDRPKMVYSLNIVYKKFTATNRGTVSYLFLIYEYTGGANGSEKVQTFTFNKNGQVAIESILDTSGYATMKGKNKMPNDLALSYLLLEQAKNDKEIFPDINTVRDGLGLSYLKDDGITLDHKKCNCDGWLYASNLQNFVITDNGLTFYFDKLAITMGAAGSTAINLSWDELAPYLSK